MSSILALNPDNGDLVWHYQTTPGDTWDYTATQHMILADLEIAGEPRKVLMQAPKNGFFYVIDRTNGQLLSAEAYVPVTWATHVDLETGRPVENPEAHYANEAKVIQPAPYGGHNWHPMSYSPDTGLVYIPALDLSFSYAQSNAFKHQPGEWNTGTDFTEMVPAKDPDQMIADLRNVRGHLAAWDPVTQQEVWRVQHQMSWNGGLLSTAGNLLFQGRADGQFAAYRADTGELLWEFPTQVGIIAAPVTFAVDGEQYVSVVAGWGGAFGLASGVPRHRDNVLAEGRMLTFKLDGKATLPPVNVAYLDIPQPPPMDTTAEQVAHGEGLYHQYCAVCHSPGVTAAGAGVADLRYAAPSTHESWDAIVLGGAFVGKGMPKFDHVMAAGDAEAISGHFPTTLQPRATALLSVPRPSQTALPCRGSSFPRHRDRKLDTLIALLTEPHHTEPMEQIEPSPTLHTQPGSPMRSIRQASGAITRTCGIESDCWKSLPLQASSPQMCEEATLHPSNFQIP